MEYRHPDTADPQPQPSKKRFQYKHRPYHQMFRHLYGLGKADAIAAWLHCVTFQYFISVNPCRERFSLAHMQAVVVRYREELERRYGIGSVGYLEAYHLQPNPNFHLCFVSRDRIGREVIEEVFRGLQEVGSNPTAIDIRDYKIQDTKNPECPLYSPVKYCLQYLDGPDPDHDGSYDFYNLKLFIPVNNPRTRRNLRRRHLQLSPAAEALKRRVMEQSRRS